jgi:uncharacterized damage-inducible protein DinB
MKTQLLKTLQNSKNYTLAVAEGMPEKSYTFKPIETVMSFKELIDHIAYGIQWWEDNYVKGNKTDWNPPAVKGTKQQTIDRLVKAYDGLEKTISASTLNEEVTHGVYTTLDHITHHRGQAVTYLRCQGIAPPDYQY